MEIVNQKFNNFKQFILEIDNTNDWVTWFVEKVDLPAFGRPTMAMRIQDSPN